MSLLFGFASGPDLLRLLAVPVFAWAAYRDVRTRRVPNRTWMPLVAVGVVALAWDGVAILDATAFSQRLFVVQTALSLGLVAPVGYVFWRLGGFGGADAKAVMTLALLYPVYPTIYAFETVFPLTQATLGVFSLTILSNAVLAGLTYPLILAGRNALRGRFHRAMVIGRPVAVGSVIVEYGRLLETPQGFTPGGLDIDAFRMYLRWRGIGLADLRADPDHFRHTTPTNGNDPGDGSIEGVPVSDGGSQAADALEDEWGAERFLTEYDAYGTTPDELRTGIEVLADPEREVVWITPGIPFIVPMFAGLVLALVYGDVLFALLAVFGLA